MTPADLDEDVRSTLLKLRAERAARRAVDTDAGLLERLAHGSAPGDVTLGIGRVKGNTWIVMQGEIE